MTRTDQKLVVLHEDESAFESGGLRTQFAYRDLGISAATGGKYNAHLIRAAGGDEPISAHRHADIDFQLVYVTRGEVTFWYEGRGKETLKAGSVHLLPPGIKHSVEGWSDDLEMVEITSPTVYSTEEVDVEAETVTEG